jgi:hypothetical protein
MLPSLKALSDWLHAPSCDNNAAVAKRALMVADCRAFVAAHP